MATERTDHDGASPATAAPRSASARRRARPAILALLVLVAALALTLDQLSKAWVLSTLQEHVSTPVLGPLLAFERTTNSGAAFSFASGSTWIFSIIAAAVVVFLVWFARKIRSVAWAVLFGLLLGGTLGNLTDRLLRPPGFGVGEVVDFIRIPLLPAIFNLADSAIVTSMCLFVLLTLLGVGLDGARRRPAED